MILRIKGSTRLGRNSVTNIPKRIPLTPIGLLMEGDYAYNRQMTISRGFYPPYPLVVSSTFSAQR